MAFKHQVLGLALAMGISSVLGAPVSEPSLQARSVISHDAVVGFDETVPATTEGNLMLKFKPYLKVFNGCVPFPAVDADGNTRYVPRPLGPLPQKVSSSSVIVFK